MTLESRSPGRFQDLVADQAFAPSKTACQSERIDRAGIEAYDRERRPTAWWHLAASQRHMGMRGQIHALYEPTDGLDDTGAEGEARRKALGAQIAAIGNAENESWGVELGYRYDDSPVIWSEAERPPVDPITYRPSTRPGARLPHVFLDHDVSIHDRLGKYFTLIALGEVNSSAVEAAARARRIPLTVLRLDRPDLRTIYERNLILVRPDQHVAWRGDTLPADLDELLAKAIGSVK